MSGKVIAAGSVLAKNRRLQTAYSNSIQSVRGKTTKRLIVARRVTLNSLALKSFLAGAEDSSLSFSGLGAAFALSEDLSGPSSSLLDSPSRHSVAMTKCQNRFLSFPKHLRNTMFGQNF
jgi:hypothetical protein